VQEYIPCAVVIIAHEVAGGRVENNEPAVRRYLAIIGLAVRLLAAAGDTDPLGRAGQCVVPEQIY
jgi:hypothetical protein